MNSRGFSVSRISGFSVGEKLEKMSRLGVPSVVEIAGLEDWVMVNMDYLLINSDFLYALSSSKECANSQACP